MLVAALLTRGTPPDLVYQAWRRGAFDLLTSDAQLDELDRVLRYEKLMPYIHPDEAAELVETLSAAAIMVVNPPPVALSPDPDDNRILAAALAGRADLIVSGDKAGMLALQFAEGIPIVSVRAAWQRLRAGP